MSLDVYLTTHESHLKSAGVFIRRDGCNVEITREEWNRLYPDREPVTTSDENTNEVYSSNITHNLNKMADAAGVYMYLWRPDEIGISKAAQLIEPLRAGLALLKSDPRRFKELNPSNGWGDYDGLVEFVEEYLNACIASPDADVGVSR